MKVLGCISLMSAPAAKAFSPPASRMQPILSSASRSSTAAAISLNTPKDSALSIFGRFSVMTPTAPLLSTMMCSNVLMVHPARDFTGQCARWGDLLQVGNGTTVPPLRGASAVKQSSLHSRLLDCFAQPVIARAFAGPVASQ